jgi:hypothetical protein
VLPFQAKPSASTATRCMRPFHSRPSMVPGLRLAVHWLRSTARCPAFAGDPERSNAIQEMAGQVSGWPPPEHAMPTSPKLADVEIAQPRNLDIQHDPVGWCRTNLDARHDVQGDCLDGRAPVFPLRAAATR